MNINDIIIKLSNCEPFAFSRWGDGEFFNVNGVDGSNCDGNIYYKDMGEELLKILQVKQDYYMGVQTMVMYSVNESKKYDQDWVDSDVFHRASINGGLEVLINQFDENNIVYIGNETLSKLPFINDFIEIPYNNVWLKREEVMNIIKSNLDDTYKVFLFSAGMVSNYFIDKIWGIDKSNAYIDVGSVFDPYVGRLSRTYHKNLNITIEYE